MSCACCRLVTCAWFYREDVWCRCGPTIVHFQDPKVWCCLGSFLLSTIWLANPNPDRECGSRMVGHSRGSRHFPQRGLYSTKEEECSTEASLSDLLRPSPLLYPVHSAIPTANTNQLQRHVLTTLPQSPLSRQPCYTIYRTRSKVRRATPRRTHFTFTTTLRSPSNCLAPLSGLIGASRISRRSSASLTSGSRQIVRQPWSSLIQEMLPAS